MPWNGEAFKMSKIAVDKETMDFLGSLIEGGRREDRTAQIKQGYSDVVATAEPVEPPKPPYKPFWRRFL